MKYWGILLCCFYWVFYIIVGFCKFVVYCLLNFVNKIKFVIVWIVIGLLDRILFWNILVKLEGYLIKLIYVYICML